MDRTTERYGAREQLVAAEATTGKVERSEDAKSRRANAAQSLDWQVGNRDSRAEVTKSIDAAGDPLQDALHRHFVSQIVANIGDPRADWSGFIGRQRRP